MDELWYDVQYKQDDTWYSDAALQGLTAEEAGAERDRLAADEDYGPSSVRVVLCRVVEL